jgi:hypothetical protein
MMRGRSIRRLGVVFMLDYELAPPMCWWEAESPFLTVELAISTAGRLYVFGYQNRHVAALAPACSACSAHIGAQSPPCPASGSICQKSDVFTFKYLEKLK